jgi:hypothetical protein
MLRLIAIGLVGLVCCLGGCVTAHEGTAAFRAIDHIDDRPMPDVYVLKITNQAVEKSGHWWVVERSEGGPMAPRAAQVLILAEGEPLHQEGSMVALLGPYAYGQEATWEYWVVRPGYDPQRFYDAHFEQACKKDKPLEITLSRQTPGSSYSDEKVLTAARRFHAIAELLPANDPPTSGMLNTLLAQVRRVHKNSWKPDDREEANNLLTQLAALQNRFPPPEQAQLTPLTDAPAAATAASPPPHDEPADVQLEPVAVEELDPPAEEALAPVNLDALQPPPPDPTQPTEPAETTATESADDEGNTAAEQDEDASSGPVKIRLESPPASDGNSQ